MTRGGRKEGGEERRRRGEGESEVKRKKLREGGGGVERISEERRNGKRKGGRGGGREDMTVCDPITLSLSLIFSVFQGSQRLRETSQASRKEWTGVPACPTSCSQG